MRAPDQPLDSASREVHAVLDVSPLVDLGYVRSEHVLERPVAARQERPRVTKRPQRRSHLRADPPATDDHDLVRLRGRVTKRIGVAAIAQIAHSVEGSAGNLESSWSSTRGQDES